MRARGTRAPGRGPRRSARGPSRRGPARRSGTSSPPATRAARRDSVSSISASRPVTSGSSGSRTRRIRASRIASAVSSSRIGALAALGEVALVEDEVEHGEHAASRARQVLGLGDPVGDLRGLDLLLRAGDPLGHRGLRDEERLRDLGHGQAAEQPQGQRHPGLRRERRVAAGEDQPEPVVLDDAGRLVGGVVSRSSVPPGAWRRGATRGGSCRSRGCRPWWSASRRGWAVRRRPATARPRRAGPRRPPPRRCRCRRSGGPARRRSGRTPRGRSARSPRWDRRVHPVVRPPGLAPGRAGPRPCPRRPSSPRWPTSARRRGRAASMTQKPPIYSLDSTNGPSVTMARRRCCRPRSSPSIGSSPPPNTQTPAVLELLVELVDGLEDRLHRLRVDSPWSGPRRCRAR